MNDLVSSQSKHWEIKLKLPVTQGAISSVLLVICVFCMCVCVCRRSGCGDFPLNLVKAYFTSVIPKTCVSSD